MFLSTKLIKQSRAFVLFLFLISYLNTTAQSSFFNASDTFNKKRVLAVNTIEISLWSSSLAVLSQAWYKEFPQTKFHFYNDNAEWLQMDKCGHVFASYQESKSLAYLYRWTGMKKKSAVLLGTGLAVGFQSTIEYLDGLSAGWGFSPGDEIANVSGGLLFGIQQYFWDQQFILCKQSYSPTQYAQLRPNELGRNFAERYLKDYNGQTYWLSFSPKLLWKQAPIPNWLLLSVGYGIDGKLEGMNNVYTASNGITYTAHREYYVSLDIDLRKLPIKRKWVKNILRPLNAIKIPLPTLHWKNGVCYGHAIYF